MTFYDSLYKIQNTFFNIFIVFSYVFVILSTLGIFNGYPDLLIQLDYYIKIYICLFLIWRFNPIQIWFFNKKIIFNDLDRKISFSAGLIILTTTIITPSYVFNHYTGQKYK